MLTLCFRKYVTNSLLLCFGDSPERQREISNCKGVSEELIRFFQYLLGEKVELYFVVDQFDALDLGRDKEDYVGNARGKKELRNGSQKSRRITSSYRVPW